MFSNKNASDLWFLVALTPLHVGVGRSPGIVDLPIARDSLGYPWIPASSLKGSIKSACVMFYSGGSSECYQYYGWDVEDYPTSEPWVSSIVFTDAFLFAFPVRAIVGGDEKIIYIIPESSIRRLNDLIVNIARCNCIREIPCSSGSESNDGESRENIIIKYFNIEDAKRVSLGEGFSCIKDKMPSFTKHIMDGYAYIVRDSIARHIVETELLRVARIRLDPQKKTVRKGALWTEEYVPQATIFAAATLYRMTRISGRTISPKCAQDFQRRLLSELNYSLFIGGKETIGRGLIKVIEARQ